MPVREEGGIPNSSCQSFYEGQQNNNSVRLGRHVPRTEVQNNNGRKRAGQPHFGGAEAIEVIRENWSNEALAEEVADIIIRCLDFSAAMGFDMDSAVAQAMLEKLAQNDPLRKGIASLARKEGKVLRILEGIGEKCKDAEDNIHRMGS